MGRNLEHLDKAIKNVKKAGLEQTYKVELTEAERLANRLRRLERIRQEILELKQSTISEIRSYQNPPPAVHQVMIATYLLLGYKEKPLKEWKNMQALLGKKGKEGLKRQVTSLDPVKVSDSVADYTEEHYLKEHQMDTIRDVSAGAATFYVWVSGKILLFVFVFAFVRVLVFVFMLTLTPTLTHILTHILILILTLPLTLILIYNYI